MGNHSRLLNRRGRQIEWIFASLAGWLTDSVSSVGGVGRVLPGGFARADDDALPPGQY